MAGPHLPLSPAGCPHLLLPAGLHLLLPRSLHHARYGRGEDVRPAVLCHGRRHLHGQPHLLGRPLFQADDALAGGQQVWSVVQLRRAHRLLLHVPGVRVVPRQVLLPPAHWLLSGAHGVLPTQSSAGPGSGSARTAGPRTAGAEPNTALTPICICKFCQVINPSGTTAHVSSLRFCTLKYVTEMPEGTPLPKETKKLIDDYYQEAKEMFGKYYFELLQIQSFPLQFALQ